MTSTSPVPPAGQASTERFVAVKAVCQVSEQAFHLSHSQILIDQSSQSISLGLTPGHSYWEYPKPYFTIGFDKFRRICYSPISDHGRHFCINLGRSNQSDQLQLWVQGKDAEVFRLELEQICDVREVAYFEKTMIRSLWNREPSCLTSVPSKRKASAAAGPEQGRMTKRRGVVPTSPRLPDQPHNTADSFTINDLSNATPPYASNPGRGTLRLTRGAAPDQESTIPAFGVNVSIAESQYEQLLQERGAFQNMANHYKEENDNLVSATAGDRYCLEVTKDRITRADKNLKDAKESFQGRLTLSEDSRRALEKELQTVRMQLDERDELVAGLQKERDDLTSLHCQVMKENDNLSEQLKAARQTICDNNSESSRLSAIIREEGDKNLLFSYLIESESETKAKQEYDLRWMYLIYLTEVDNLRTVIRTSKSLRDVAEEQLVTENAARQKHEKQVSWLRTKLDDTEREQKRLQEQLLLEEKAKEVSVEKVDGLEGAIGALQELESKRAEEKQALSKTLESAYARLARLQEKEKSLKDATNQAETAYREKTKEVEKLFQTVTSLQKANDEYEEKVDAMEHANDSLMSSNTNKAEEIQALRTSLGMLQELKSELSARGHEVDKLKSEFQESNIKLEEQVEKASKQANQAAVMQRRISNIKCLNYRQAAEIRTLRALVPTYEEDPAAGAASSSQQLSDSI